MASDPIHPAPSEPGSDPRQRDPSPPRRLLVQGPGESLIGTAILSDFGSPAGAILTRIVQEIHRWASVEPAERPRLFANGALFQTFSMLEHIPIDPDLRTLLTRVGRGLLGTPPAQAERIALMCRRIAQVAERRGELGTALAFAQAAALADPKRALPALKAGVLALRRGEEARAESWFCHAVVLARRNQDQVCHARAHLELGKLSARQGSPLRARRFYLRALRQAQRNGLEEIHRIALHALAVLEGEGEPV